MYGSQLILKWVALVLPITDSDLEANHMKNTLALVIEGKIDGIMTKKFGLKQSLLTASEI